MRQKQNTPNLLMTFAGILMSLVLFTTYLVSGLYARFTVSGNAEDGARVAAFVFDVEESGSTAFLELEGMDRPNTRKEYQFKVTNSQNGKTSEVAEKYTVSILAMSSLPLTYTLTDSAQTGSIHADKVIEWNPAETSGTFSASVTADRTYTLSVEWPAGENDPKYASNRGMASLRIDIMAEQVN